MNGIGQINMRFVMISAYTPESLKESLNAREDLFTVISVFVFKDKIYALLDTELLLLSDEKPVVTMTA